MRILRLPSSFRVTAFVAITALTIALGMPVAPTRAQADDEQRGSISGRVVDYAGQPVAVQVCAAVWPDTSEVSCADSDRTGHYSITGLRPVVYWMEVNGGLNSQALFAGLDPFGGRKDPLVTVPPGAAVVQDIRTERRATISGKVTDVQGQPVNNILVELMYLRPGKSARQIHSVRTDPTGDYTMPMNQGTAMSNVAIAVNRNKERGYGSAWLGGEDETGARQFTAPGIDGTLTGLDVTITAGTRIAGRVSWPTGIPVVGIARLHHRVAGQWEVADSQTLDTYGSYSFGKVDPDSVYRVGVTPVRGPYAFEPEPRFPGDTAPPTGPEHFYPDADSLESAADVRAVADSMTTANFSGPPDLPAPGMLSPWPDVALRNASLVGVAYDYRGRWMEAGFIDLIPIGTTQPIATAQPVEQILKRPEWYDRDDDSWRWNLWREARGRFWFPHVPSGQYIVRVRPAVTSVYPEQYLGYTQNPAEAQVVTITNDANGQFLPIGLRFFEGRGDVTALIDTQAQRLGTQAFRMSAKVAANIEPLRKVEVDVGPKRCSSTKRERVVLRCTLTKFKANQRYRATTTVTTRAGKARRTASFTTNSRGRIRMLTSVSGWSQPRKIPKNSQMAPFAINNGLGRTARIDVERRGVFKPLKRVKTQGGRTVFHLRVTVGTVYRIRLPRTPSAEAFDLSMGVIRRR